MPRGHLERWKIAADVEQREELELYVDLTAEEYIARGMDPAEAMTAARRKLGKAA